MAYINRKKTEMYAPFSKETVGGPHSFLPVIDDKHRQKLSVPISFDMVRNPPNTWPPSFIFFIFFLRFPFQVPSSIRNTNIIPDTT